MKLTLCFIRQDRDVVLVAGRFTGQFTNHNELLHLLRNSITQWIQETAEGRKLWNYSGKDLNVGDVADFLFDPQSSLAPFLHQHKIEQAQHLYTLIESDRIAFDTVLANPNQLNL